RLPGSELIRWQDGNMTSWQKFPLLGRRGVAYEVDDVCLQSGIVDQCVPFGSRTIRGHRFPALFLFEQKCQEVVLYSICLTLEILVEAQIQQAEIFLSF